jgi:hypothetical protein
MEKLIQYLRALEVAEFFGSVTILFKGGKVTATEELARKTGAKGTGPIAVTVKVGRKDPYLDRNPDLAQDVALGAVLDEEIKALRAKQDEVKERIRGYVEGLDTDAGTVRIGTEANGVPVEAKVTSRSTAKIEDVDGLKGYLGARFDDLVKTKVEHKPTAMLVEIAVAGEEDVREYLKVIRPAATVVFEKPEK